MKAEIPFMEENPIPGERTEAPSQGVMEKVDKRTMRRALGVPSESTQAPPSVRSILD